jgi:protein-S-isoprenylcysteine O-methyltransferase Ste14
VDDLAKTAYAKLAKFQVALAVVIFAPAWSLAYWQGWLTWGLFLFCCVAITHYFLRHDRALIVRRMEAGPAAEREPRQKLILTFASVLMIATFLVSALDHGAGWSRVPSWVSLTGAALVVAGFAVVFQTFRDNSFAAATVQVDSAQHVVDSGLYARMRHPMYSGSLLLFTGIPLCLGSWWGLVPAALLIATIIWRLIDEENFLARNLAGYDDYRGRVRTRLVPGVW